MEYMYMIWMTRDELRALYPPRKEGRTEKPWLWCDADIEAPFPLSLVVASIRASQSLESMAEHGGR